MELKEKIEKQISAGFSKEEIYNQLLADGHSKEEIDKQLKETNIAIKNNSAVSGKTILVGIGLFIVIILRIARYSNSQSSTASSLGMISIVLGIIVLILYLARRH